MAGGKGCCHVAIEIQEAPSGMADDISGTVEQVLPIVYEELRAVARRERRRLAGGETLATTALINETYLKLANNPAFASRGSFLRIASVAMRRILVDRVRAQFALKRGSGESAVTIEEIHDFVVDDEQHVMNVHEALQALSALNPRLVEIVECRFFAGYSESQTAEALGVSERTVQRDWAIARAWLKKELGA